MSSQPGNVVRVIDSAVDCPEIPLVDGQGNAKVILWPGNGAEFRSMHLFTLFQGDCSKILRHANDCVYYVVEGAGRIEGLDGADTQELVEGSIVHIDANDGYRVVAGDEGIKYLGGPCPPDEALYKDLAVAGSASK